MNRPISAGPATYTAASNPANAAANPGAAASGAIGVGGHPRPSSDVLASSHYKSPEAEAIDRWFEDLSYYEKTLEQMAHAKLDDNFREELKAIEQWFSVLSDPERTTALYSLLQHTTPVQVRFLITVLQQMSQKDGGAGGTAPSPIVGSAPGSSKPMMGVGKDDDKYLSAGMLPLGSGDTANAGTRARRLYDRHSAPTGEEVKRTDDVISSANWSVASPTSSTGPGLRVYPHAGGPGGAMGSPTTGGSPGGFSIATDPSLLSRSPYARSKSPRPVSPIFVNPSLRPGAQTGHPGDGWGHVSLGGGTHGTLRPPASPSGAYAHSDFSDSYDEYGTDGFDSDMKGRAGSQAGSVASGVHKEKGKIPEAVDLEALKDIPAWLRSLRLHKYTSIFEGSDWREMVKLTDEDLIRKGVSALGARRKLLKVFELIRNESGIAM